MVVEINRVFENLRVGITFRKLKNYSVSKLASSIESIELEKNAPLVGKKKRVILQADPIEKKNEYHISSIVDVPFKVKELVLEDEKIKINERIEYIPKNIEAIIRLKTQTIILFTQTQNAVRRFSKYIRKVTLNGFYPVPMKFSHEAMRNIIKYFKNINNLKVVQGENEKIKSIGIRGENLLKDKLVSDILSNKNFNINEIGGSILFSNDEYGGFYINCHGRACFYGSSDQLTFDNIYNLIQKIEDFTFKNKIRNRGD